MAFDGKIESFPEFQNSREELLARARQLRWYHSIKLDDSLTTEGEFDLYPSVPHYLPCPDLSRADCLDIGAGNGFWCFEMEKKNARSITALDIPDFTETDFSAWHGRDNGMRNEVTKPGAFGENLRIAACLFRSTLSYRLCNVYDLRPESAGTFDLVHCGSMLMHLFAPMLALRRMASVCRDTFLITTEVELSLEGLSAMQYRGHEISFVHFVPSPTCLVNMLVSCGYEKVLRGPTFHLRFRDHEAMPLLLPHTTCIGLKEGSKNVLGLPPPGLVSDADRIADIEFASVPKTALPGQTIEVLINVINRSPNMWHLQDAAHNILAGLHWELSRDGVVVESIPRDYGHSVPIGHFLPAGLGTLAGVKVRIPRQEGTLRLKPFMMQDGKLFEIAAPDCNILVTDPDKPQQASNQTRGFLRRLAGG